MGGGGPTDGLLQNPASEASGGNSLHHITADSLSAGPVDSDACVDRPDRAVVSESMHCMAPALGSAPGASGSSQRSEGSERFVNASFLVFAQDYVPESVQVRFPVPSSADSILQMVGSARAPHFRDRFPVLKPVCPQPWSRIGTLVAMPPWPLRGVAVVFDLCVSTAGASRLLCRLSSIVRPCCMLPGWRSMTVLRFSLGTFPGGPT